MKLQACSKIITLTTLGFTLTAAGTFYALNSAEHSIDTHYQQELNEHLTAVGADLHRYVQKINSDYYELLNSSLNNILALDQCYYSRDPLLNFFDKNIRTHSAYAKGENLVYALEGLSYFGVPYIAYDLESKELSFHGFKEEDNGEDSEKEQQRLLRARDQNEQSLEKQIQTPYALPHSFTLLYSGSDTFLCLRLYDKETHSNYYIISSYLTVLENIALNLKTVFSDIDIKLQKLFENEAVIIARRNQTILKTKDFDLDLDLNNAYLRSLIGVRIIDKNGQPLESDSTLPPQEQHDILAVSYVRSINSYLVLKRPFNLLKSDTNVLFWSKIAIILISLIFIAAVAQQSRNDNRAARLTITKFKKLSRLLNNLNGLTSNAFKELLDSSAIQVSLRTATIKAVPANDPTRSTTANNSIQNSKINDGDRPSANSKTTDKIDTITNTTTSSILQKITASDTATTNANSNANNNEPNNAPSKTNKAQNATDTTTNTTSLNNDNSSDTTSIAINNTITGVGTDTNTSADKIASTSNALEIAPNQAQEVPELSPLQTANTDDIANFVLTTICQKERVEFLESDNPAWQVISTMVRLAQGLEQESNAQIEATKQEFKSRIPLYRKEGQCIASRQMLLNALPSEEAMPSSNFVDFAAFTVPARDLSGNFYSIQRLDDDNLAFVIGDCSSSGTKAAYTVAVVSILVSEALKLDLDPPHVMQYLNERLCAIPHISPVGLFIGMISEKTGNVIAANAGHCVPIVVDDTGPHFVAQFNEQQLGLHKEQEFELIKWYLSNNDMVILYSKGILNVKNNEGEIFGMDRLLDHCVGSNALRADELIIKILNDLKRHKGKRPFREDVSLICLKQLRIQF